MPLPAGPHAPEYYAGIGYDVHPLVQGRKLVLGGVNVPYHLGLMGHSDADVMVHAVMDAILGASGQGDIGELFPNTDPKHKGASSIALLEEVGRRVAGAGFTVVNVDVVLLAEEPKIAAYKERMRVHMAKALGMDAGRVNIKATTSEGLGFVGEKRGMAAYAAVSLRKG